MHLINDCNQDTAWNHQKLIKSTLKQMVQLIKNKGNISHISKSCVVALRFKKFKICFVFWRKGVNSQLLITSDETIPIFFLFRC